MNLKEKIFKAYEGAQNGAESRQMQKAFGDSGAKSNAVLLSQDQAKEFIDRIVGKDNILSIIRTEKVSANTTELHRILQGKRFLRPGDQNATLDNGYEVETDKISITTVKLRGHIDVTDDEILNNIEGDSLKDRLLDHVVIKARNDIADIILNADKDGGKSGADVILNKFDGVFKLLKAGNAAEIDASTIGDGTASRELFRKSLKSLEPHDRKTAEFLVPDDVMLDYQALFDNSYNRSEMINNIVGKKSHVVDALEAGDDGKFRAINTDPKNIIAAFQASDGSISFEAERRASEGLTRFHVVIWLGIAVEDPKKAVVIKQIASK